MQKPNRSFAKKVFAAGLAVSTVLWASTGLFAFVAQADVTAHPAGTLVLSGGTVWRITDAGTGRQGIDSLAKFDSNRFSFANVVPANSADLALPDSGLASWGSGVLFNDGGTVYQVSGGMKHGFTSAANFTGNGFSFANVMSAGSLAAVPSGANIDNTSAAHLEGTFVVSGGTVWRITATGRTGVPSPGVFYAWGGNWGEVVPANAADLALANEGNATYRTGAIVNDGGTIFAVTATAKNGFPTADCFTGFGFNFSMPVAGSTSGLTAGANLCGSAIVPPPPTSSAGVLSVSLASDTPVSATIVKSAARVGFTKVNFTASGGNVNITQLTIQRVGVSADSNFTDIILLDVSGGLSTAKATQIGNEKSLNSSHQAVSNDVITVLNGTTKSLMLAANMASTVNSADQAQLSLVSMQVGGTATVSGALPITGNTMTMNNSVAISSVTIAAGGQNPAASSQNVGTTAYVATSLKFTIGSQEDVTFSHIAFYNNGTAGDTDVANLKLWYNGTVIGSAPQLTNKYVVFDLASPVVITKGNNAEFPLTLDIVNGSGRTIEMDIYSKADVVVTGNTYGFNILPSYPNTSSPFFSNSSNQTTISKGSITFSKGTLASTNASKGVTQQPLGAFKTTVQGEPIQTTSLPIGITTTGTGKASDVSNLTIKDSTGKVVGGPLGTTTGASSSVTGTATSTDTIIFPVGTNTYTIYGDLDNTFVTNDTVVLRLKNPSTKQTAKGTVTNQTVTPGPSSDVTLDTMTAKAGSLLVSTQPTPAAQNVIVGTSGFVDANFVFDASNSGEDVRITQIALKQTVSAVNKQANVANLSLWNGNTQLLPLIQPVNSATLTVSTSTFSLTSPIVVAKGTSASVQLKLDVVSGSAADTFKFGLVGGSVTAVGATTASTITPSVTNSSGQLMTIAASGTVTVAADGSDPTNGSQLVGGASKATAGVLIMTATNEAVDLRNLELRATAVNSGSLKNDFTTVYLFDGSTQIASGVPTSSTAITFTIPGGTFTIPAGSGGKKLTIKVDSALVTNNNNDGNTGAAGTGINFKVNEDGYSFHGNSSGVDITPANKSGNYTGVQYTIYKSTPTYAASTVPTSILANGTGVPLFRFTLTADSHGDIGFYKATFDISTSTATVTAFQLFENPGTTGEQNLTANASRGVSNTLTDGTPTGHGGLNQIAILFNTDTTGATGVGNGGAFRFVSAGTTKTYELRGTVANSTTGSSVSVRLDGDAGFSASYPGCAGGATVGNNTCAGLSSAAKGNFVWSDLAYGNSSTTATLTAEWFNGFHVPGLTSTTTAQTVSK